MSGQVKKQDTITIVIQGPKKIRQVVIDKVYLAILDEELLGRISSPRAILKFDSTLKPSEEVLSI